MNGGLAWHSAGAQQLNKHLTQRCIAGRELTQVKEEFGYDP
jgi:hypothetical protein